MSYHIVHVLQHGSRINVDRGSLVCRTGDQPEKRIPKRDVLALVVAARGISFSSNAIADLLASDSIILHCDENYRPIGKSVALHSIVHTNIFEQQIRRQGEFADALWAVILRAKITNQAMALDYLNLDHQLWIHLQSNDLDEGNSARHYWGRYFTLYGKKRPKGREYQGAKHSINRFLNYGYAVMGAILHRSIIAHGLNTTLGVHHKYRFKSDPLLYDMIEPFRPVVDYMLYNYHASTMDRSEEGWAKYIANGLINMKVSVNDKKNVKLLYAIDRYASTVADCYYTGEVSKIFIPNLTMIKFEK